ncbi:lytic murein transglycosylase [Mesorhizobium sp. M8A.F.Ca.ET.059.01.1.1]|nr:lytic murein transglycosylase [Mesorhizobium sp. M8A.F.Ca.ET.059.01.1.1]
MSKAAFCVAPLCPAGHLPLNGGDRLLSLLSPTTTAREKMPSAKLPISPLEGEMSGRTEGGAWH